MTFESEKQKREVQVRSRLALQLNGAADSGRYDHITTDVIVGEVTAGRVFDFLARELPGEVWAISKVTDVDRHSLGKMWHALAVGYDPAQFHVRRNGLSLLVAYLLHMVDIRHATAPT